MIYIYVKQELNMKWMTNVKSVSITEIWQFNDILKTYVDFPMKCECFLEDDRKNTFSLAHKHTVK